MLYDKCSWVKKEQTKKYILEYQIQVPKKYKDFRKMHLKSRKIIDAVVISTPKYINHGVIAIEMAMKMGKHVYCEKPLAHSVFESTTKTRRQRQQEYQGTKPKWATRGIHYKEIRESFIFWKAGISRSTG